MEGIERRRLLEDEPLEGATTDRCRWLGGRGELLFIDLGQFKFSLRATIWAAERASGRRRLTAPDGIGVCERAGGRKDGRIDGRVSWRRGQHRPQDARLSAMSSRAIAASPAAAAALCVQIEFIEKLRSKVERTLQLGYLADIFGGQAGAASGAHERAARQTIGSPISFGRRRQFGLQLGSDTRSSGATANNNNNNNNGWAI